MIIRVFIVAALLLLLDIYFYQAILVIFKGASVQKRNLIFWCYWGFTLISTITLISPLFAGYDSLPKFFRIYIFAFFIMVILSKLVGTLFLGLDDIIRFFKWLFSFLIKPANAGASEIIQTEKNAITRSQFLSQTAIFMTALPFVSFLYGMVKGAFNYKVHNHKVILPKLPAAFNGLKIVQISDIHSGSFMSEDPLKEATRLIMEQKPDIIFFTGDLVNNEAAEMEMFINVLSSLNAPLGVYSILGNHDYGEYKRWESEEAKIKNFNRLKQIHGELGWQLLLNENKIIERNGEAIAIIGVENWGGNLHFTKYGDLSKAYQGTEKYPVKLLLSHDPSHWSMVVKEAFKDIDVTFSGHTHGFQFGVEIPGWIKWSPSQFVYKQWAGLYNEGNQYLYVNRGLGFLGYPGRIGIMPEITVMELFNS